MHIVDVYNECGDFSEAARCCDTSRDRVRRWVRRYEETGDVQDAPRSGRPSKLRNPLAAGVIDRALERELGCPQISKALAEEANIIVSTEAVRQHLHKFVGRPLVTAKKPVITPTQAKRRLAFSKEWLRKPWSNVVVTDSKYFWLTPKGRGKKVWVKYGRKPGHGKLCRNSIKVHVYGGVTKWRPSHQGRTPLFVTVGTTGLKADSKGVNAQVYRELLQDKLIPACKRMMEPFYGPTGWVFQQDNAKAHTAKLVKAWQQEQSFQLMDWPANSPDLSWVESIWSWMAMKLRDRKDLTANNFQQAILETWDSIPKTVMEAQFRSIRGDKVNRGRLPECIAVMGYQTRY